MLAQVKCVWLRLKLTEPLLSLLPLFMAEAGTVALPVASRLTVMFLAIATGGIRSTRVTVAVAVALFPLGSVTVSVTGVAPMFAPVKDVWLNVKEAMLQLSLLPLFTWEGSRVAFPAAFNCMVTFCALATGAILSITVTTTGTAVSLPL